MSLQKKRGPVYAAVRLVYRHLGVSPLMDISLAATACVCDDTSIDLDWDFILRLPVVGSAQGTVAVLVLRVQFTSSQ